MPERTSRTFWARGAAASVTAGRIKCRMVPEPYAGSSPPSSTAKSRISMMPSQKAGIDWRNRDARRLP
jgi:hypothetical protein